MRFPDYESYDAVGLAGRIGAGEITATDALDAALDRIKARNPTLNAVIRLSEDAAREAAARVSGGSGPLAGVPFLLKDLGVARTGQPTSNGTGQLAGVPVGVTSTVVARLEATGLIVAGRTNTPEFGLSFTTEPRAFGATRNPWATDRTAGGSSGGAAAAVASGMVPAAHASDGGGSIRVPAAFCGLFGLKPSRGRVPVGPVLGEAWGGLATSHVISRSVRDSAALLDVVAGPEPGDPYAAPRPGDSYREAVATAPGRLRIALQTEPSSGVAVAEDCRAAAQDAARLCETLGHIVEDAAPALDADAIGAAFMTTVTAHLADDIELIESWLGKAIGDDALETMTAALRAQGRGGRLADYARARNTLHGVGRRVGQFLQSYDVLLTPTTAQPPPPLGYLDADAPDVAAELSKLLRVSPFTQIANITGCPAMSVPLTWSSSGLPSGAMFMAPLGREDLLFRLAGQLEAARPWWHRRPPIARISP